jgi:hypothetical protein
VVVTEKFTRTVGFGAVDAVDLPEGIAANKRHGSDYSDAV